MHGSSCFFLNHYHFREGRTGVRKKFLDCCVLVQRHLHMVYLAIMRKMPRYQRLDQNIKVYMFFLLPRAEGGGAGRERRKRGGESRLGEDVLRRGRMFTQS